MQSCAYTTFQIKTEKSSITKQKIWGIYMPFDKVKQGLLGQCLTLHIKWIVSATQYFHKIETCQHAYWGRFY